MESSFEERIATQRSLEIAQLLKAGVVTALSTVLTNAGVLIPPCVSFVTYVGSGRVLDSALAFTALSIFYSLWFPSIMLSVGLQKFGSVRPCFARLRLLMSRPDMADRPEWIRDLKTGELGSLTLEESVFSYGKESFTVGPVSLSAKGGELIMLAGAVGSGKTALIEGILGQLSRESGGLNLCGIVGYAPQRAFIINGSVRENVLFGLPFDAVFFEACVRTSCLDADLLELRDGAETMIGEKGVNISGGQKARIALSRALYSRAQVLILDDILSALDAKVQSELFSRLVTHVAESKQLLIMANHHLHFAGYFDMVLVLEDGRVLEQGAPEELMAKKGALYALSQDYGAEDAPKEEETEEEEFKNELVDNKETTKEKQEEKEVFQLVENETAGSGTVAPSVWGDYLGLYGAMRLSFLLIGFLSFTAIRAYIDFLLAAWVSDEWRHGFAGWAGLYVGATVAVLALMLLTLIALVASALRAAEKLHREVLHRLLHGTMSFFWSVPVGRILTRMSRDVDVIDFFLPYAVDQFATLFFQAISIFVTVAVVYPIALVIFLPILAVFVTLVWCKKVLIVFKLVHAYSNQPQC